MNNLNLLLGLALLGFLLMTALGNRRWAGWMSVCLYAAQLLLIVNLGLDLRYAAAVATGPVFLILDQPLHWAMSGLGWFFAVITLVSALLCAWFAAGRWQDQQPRMRLFHSALALNVLAMLLLLSSGDMISLFIGWELVSWASFLIMAQRGGEAMTAAFRYLLYAIAGAMAVLGGMALLWVEAGSLTFPAIRSTLATASPGLVWKLILLFGAGFGVKMALVPLHLWQARAYSETPGPAAAFLGAISSRMGLFAILIVFVQLVGIGRMAGLDIPFTFLSARDLFAWVAAITIVVPTFIALQQSDARMLLAWHGIGQGGYMLLGVLTGNSLGAAGGLMHIINHASYQAPLFLAVTAVVYRAGTADLDRLGGLITRMPLTYVTMLIGIIGLAGLPPMNGFVSKWIIYKALLDAHMPLLFIVAVIGTLGTILSVYKLIHNIFLGQLRQEHREIQEVPVSMSAPMLVFGAMVFITGFFPGLLLGLVDFAQTGLGIALQPHHLGGIETPNGSLNMIWVVGALLFMIGMGAVIFLLGNRSHRTHQLDNYAGGHFLTADVRYHYSHNFYPGLMRALAPLYRGSVRWAEQGLASLTELLANGVLGLYRNAYTPAYLVIAAVIMVWWAGAL